MNKVRSTIVDKPTIENEVFFEKTINPTTTVGNNYNKIMISVYSDSDKQQAYYRKIDFKEKREMEFYRKANKI